MSSLQSYSECTQPSFSDHAFTTEKLENTASSREFPFDLIDDPESAVSIPFNMELFESNLFNYPFWTSSLQCDAEPSATTPPSTSPSNDEASPSYMTDDFALSTYSSGSPPSPHTPTVHISDVESEPHMPPAIVEYTPRRKSPYKSTRRDPNPSKPTPVLKCMWEGCTYKGGFKRRYDLRRHVRSLHTSPRSYACLEPDCNGKRVFNRKDGLQNHIRRYHNGASSLEPSPIGRQNVFSDVFGCESMKRDVVYR